MNFPFPPLRIHLEALSDYQKHGHDLGIWCRGCAHKVVIVPTELIGQRAFGSIEKLERRLRRKRRGSGTRWRGAPRTSSEWRRL